MTEHGRHQTEEAVREFLRARGAPSRVVDGGLEGMVAEWEQVAESVERGYPLDTLDDYLNDMDGRQLIHEAIAALPAPAPASIASRLAQADERVRAFLVPADRCLWGDAIATKHGWDSAREWWYYMRPSRPGSGLSADLGVEG